MKTNTKKPGGKIARKFAKGFTMCKHCGKKITGKAKLAGLAFVCPYCGKPTGNGTPGTGYKWGKVNNLKFTTIIATRKAKEIEPF